MAFELFVLLTFLRFFAFTFVKITFPVGENGLCSNHLKFTSFSRLFLYDEMDQTNRKRDLVGINSRCVLFEENDRRENIAYFSRWQISLDLHLNGIWSVHGKIQSKNGEIKNIYISNRADEGAWIGAQAKLTAEEIKHCSVFWQAEWKLKHRETNGTP